jgi:hypothetical protein
MEVTTVFSRSFPETTALQLNSWHLDDTATHRGSYAFGNGALDTDFSVLHPNQPPMRLSRRLSMKVHENKEVFGLDLLSQYN